MTLVWNDKVVEDVPSRRQMIQHRKSLARMGPQRQYLYLHWTLALNTDTEHWHLTLQHTKRIIIFLFKINSLVFVGISIISGSWILKVVEQSKERKCFIFWSANLLIFLDSLLSQKNYVKCVDVSISKFLNILLTYNDTNWYKLFWK